MKIVKDNEGEVVATVKSNHGCLKFLGVITGIGLLIGLLSGQEGIGGILAGIALIAILIFATVMKNKNRDTETQETPQPEENSESE